MSNMEEYIGAFINYAISQGVIICARYHVGNIKFTGALEGYISSWQVSVLSIESMLYVQHNAKKDAAKLVDGLRNHVQNSAKAAEIQTGQDKTED